MVHADKANKMLAAAKARSRLAIALAYASPDTISLALGTWLPAATPFVAAGDVTVPSCKIVSVKPQTRKVGKFARTNHPTDNRHIEIIRIANATLSFDWLLVGDGDTCFDVERAKELLTNYNAEDAVLAGVVNARGFQHADGRIPRAPVWPYGGNGYALSRGLLQRIQWRDWRYCEEDLRNFGGDVRVASCIFYLTGTTVQQVGQPPGRSAVVGVANRSALGRWSRPWEPASLGYHRICSRPAHTHTHANLTECKRETVSHHMPCTCRL